MTRDDFLQQATAAATAASAESGFPAGITVAQAALESAWGQSRLSREANNYFGIKALAKYERIAMPTFEVEGGVRKPVTAWFARFASMEECFRERDRVIATGALFAEARAAKADAEQFVRALAKHWATDPAYAEKILAIYRRFELQSPGQRATGEAEDAVSQGG